MKRIWLLSIVLLAVAAMEFGALGAASAGASFVPGWLASSKERPAESRDGKRTPTPASPPSQLPCQPDREHGRSAACDREPASIQLTPDPLVIECNGYDRSTLTVRITDAKGHAVTDGTLVSFWAYNGIAMPAGTQTKNGMASTSVAFYGDIFPSGPNLNVATGPLEAGVRIRCFPRSDGPNCPPSPPPSSPPSPSCLTPTPFSPPPCDPWPAWPSPPAVSPPCATPTVAPTPGPTWTPAPTTTPVPGGEISFGTPALTAGQITVPVLISTPPNPWHGFNLHVTYDGALLTGTAAQAGDWLQASASGFICTALVSDGGPNGKVVACSLLGAGSVSSAGTLATLIFTPLSASGCTRLHLVTYGPPDGGTLATGTFTLAASSTLQHNTYGPDITINVADGTTGCAAPPLPTATPPQTPSPPSPPVG
jgi:hypothetical protein